MIRIGTRKSILALAQAELISSQIQEIHGYETTIVKISSIGDKDQISKLTSFRGQGVFTGTLEKALAEGEVDIAVHSLKDLPVNVREDLPIIAYYKRHTPGDSLLIKSNLVKSTDPLELEKNIRVATGSPRRQSQFLDIFPTAVPVDIRGNVHTRLSRLETKFIDGLIMASAVFDRIDLPMPDGITRIDLDPTRFPPAAGQASIAVQVRKGEFTEFSEMNDPETQTSVTTERQILDAIGGGCELSLGCFITNEERGWILHASYAEENWIPGENSQLTRFNIIEDSPEKLIDRFLENFQPSIESDESELLQNKFIGLSRHHKESIDYQASLRRHGAVVISQPILSYVQDWDVLESGTLLKYWDDAEWIVISSSNAVPVLSALNQKSPLSKRYAAVGPKTASTLRSYDFPVHIVGRGGMSELSVQLENALDIYPGEVLYLRGEDFSSLPISDCKHFPVYTAKIQEFNSSLTYDYLVVYSSRSAEAIIEQKGIDITETWVAIGSSTYKTIRKYTEDVIQANSPSPRGVTQAILEDL